MQFPIRLGGREKNRYPRIPCRGIIVRGDHRKEKQIKKIAMVIGTRPEAIKLAPLAYQMRLSSEFDLKIYSTGQHRELLEQSLAVFRISPDTNLDLMKPGQGLPELTANILVEMTKILDLDKPDVILVQGDTTTALASAMAAFYSGVPIGHVEAGLRTNNLKSPFPEEFNRQIITRIAKWHFAPTNQARENLILEGVGSDEVTVTGNTIIDALMFVLDEFEKNSILRTEIESELSTILFFPWKNQRFIIVTSHRRENFGKGLEQICQSIVELSQTYPETHFVFPVHPNPFVRGPVDSLLKGLSNVHLIEPLSYQNFAYLLRYCHLILTDSGGIQEEAPSLGKPVLIMRDSTERPEGVMAGTAVLVGSSRENISKGVQRIMDDDNLYNDMAKAHNPFGDGKASNRIMQVLRDTLN
jgi:UDP-N-acetylglucosamine 2-epimerase (non-hydrolysing)